LNDAQSVGNDAHANPLFVTGSLSTLVSVGADETGTFSLVGSPSGLPVLHSQGALVLYDVTGNTLTGYVEVGGGAGFQAGTDRAVFTLAVTSGGTYTFTLLDQLDHATGNGENNLALDLSSAVKFTDFDGDSVPLSADFTINVTDDN